MINTLLDRLVMLLPEKDQPYAKHFIPGLVVLLGTLAYAIQHGIETNDWSALHGPQMEVGLVGLFVLFVSFWFENGPEGVRKFAKAVAASVTALVTLGVHCLLTGNWDNSAWRITIAGVVTAALVFLVPNFNVFIPKAGDPVTPPDLEAPKA